MPPGNNNLTSPLRMKKPSMQFMMTPQKFSGEGLAGANSSDQKSFSEAHFNKSCVSLDRSNATMNHAVTANCLRKCTYWGLSIVDTHNKSSQQCFRVHKNSGIALHQMNYEVLKDLSPEQLK